MTDAHPQVQLHSLAGRTILLSGGSRGIGLSIAVRAARDGANVVLLAKTDQPHHRLAGTVHTAAAQITACGGQALAVVGDVRDDDDVRRAVDAAITRFGGIDVVVNNASAIDLSPTEQLTMKRYDLMHDINVRGAFLLAKTALPHLAVSPNPHILTLSPPLDLRPEWAGAHVGYSMSKWAMSLVTLGLAAEQRTAGIAANSLWPRTTIATAAVSNVVGDDAMVSSSRTPEIMADAAHIVLTRPARTCTGNFYIDQNLLEEAGVTDFSRYRVEPGDRPLTVDLFTSPWDQT